MSSENFLEVLEQGLEQAVRILSNNGLKKITKLCVQNHIFLGQKQFLNSVIPEI